MYLYWFTSYALYSPTSVRAKPWIFYFIKYWFFGGGNVVFFSSQVTRLQGWRTNMVCSVVSTIEQLVATSSWWEKIRSFRTSWRWVLITVKNTPFFLCKPINVACRFIDLSGRMCRWLESALEQKRHWADYWWFCYLCIQKLKCGLYKNRNIDTLWEQKNVIAQRFSVSFPRLLIVYLSTHRPCISRFQEIL